MSVLEIAEMNGIGDPMQRRRQTTGEPFPLGTVIVSADGHWLEGDLWFDRFPSHLKDKAPRMVFESGGWHIVINHEKPQSPEEARMLCSAFECIGGMNNVPDRLKDLDAEGIEKELLFPQRLFGLYIAGDLEYREHIFAAYNQYMSEVCAQAPERLYFVAVPNYWNPAATAESMQEIRSLGARAVMIPIHPRKDIDGEPIYWASDKMEPFWAAIENAGLPLCFHIGEQTPTQLPGAIGASVLTQMQGFRPSWGALTFGGVFDRHPGMRVVFLEGGISWAASAVHDADMIYNSFITQMQPRLIHPPSWYWFNHCYATFMTDPTGLELLHRIGADRVMWTADYPHFESTLGYTRSAIAAVFAATDVTSAQKILGKTALALFNMASGDSHAARA
jgi:predicted TIM-barrel fold metal-dependent hydrolase